MFPEMLYSDYLEKWLEITRVKIKVTTYSSYQNMAKANIIPYFSKKKIRLKVSRPSIYRRIILKGFRRSNLIQ